MVKNTNESLSSETVQIDGTVYIVISSFTPEYHEQRGNLSLASIMRANNKLRSVYLRKPKGNKIFIASQSVDGRFTTPKTQNV